MSAAVDSEPEPDIAEEVDSLPVAVVEIVPLSVSLDLLSLLVPPQAESIDIAHTEVVSRTARCMELD